MSHGTIDLHTRPLTPKETWLEALAALQLTAEEHARFVKELHKLLRPTQSAGELRGPIKLTAAKPTSDQAAKKGAKSVTIVNPYDVKLSVGPMGISAQNVAALDVPPTSWMTLPITAEDLELGVDLDDLASLGTDELYVPVFLYETPQPFAAGVLA